VRFGARLCYEQAVDPGVAAFPVPPLLLQPLVENAVNHGIAQILEGGTVRLQAALAGSALRIVVENPFDRDGGRIQRHGVGLDNVRKRLATQYGGRATVDVDDANGRFRVTMTLPAAAP
jgi:LytS/YehU family sensor histidine kinase